MIQFNGDDDEPGEHIPWQQFFDNVIVALAPVVAKTVSDGRTFPTFEKFAHDVAQRTVHLAEEILMYRDASVRAMVEINEEEIL